MITEHYLEFISNSFEKIFESFQKIQIGAIQMLEQYFKIVTLKFFEDQEK
jgi:hypothetical protein